VETPYNPLWQQFFLPQGGVVIKNHPVLPGGLGNALLGFNLSGKLLGAHVAHSGLIVFWADFCLKSLTSSPKTMNRA